MLRKLSVCSQHFQTPLELGQGQLTSSGQWTLSRSEMCHFWIEEVNVNASALTLSLLQQPGRPGGEMEASYIEGRCEQGSKLPDEETHLTCIRLYRL